MFSFIKTLPEEVGVSSSCIKKLMLTLDEKEIPMHSLLIMKDDKLILEKCSISKGYSSQNVLYQ